MRLFIEHVQAVKPDFLVTRENAVIVAEICARVDGLPLAIELAAARIRLFSPQALLDRLGDRLTVLRGGAHDLPARQQALHNTIEWSYDLLDTDEKRLFELVSVFSGGCSFVAVEAVAEKLEYLDNNGEDILDRLTSLLDKSLVRLVDQNNREARLAMLETIREYATERLRDQPEFEAAARRAHAAYFAEFSRLQWERLTGADREPALEELGADLENVRTAWRYWVENRDLEQLGKLVDSLWLLFDVRGWYHATVGLTTELLEFLSTTPSTPKLAQQEIVLRASLARALLATRKDTAPRSSKPTCHALELSQAAGENAQLYPVLRGLFSFYSLRGEFEKGFSIGEQILSLAKLNDNLNMQVDGHFVLGTSYLFTGNYQHGLEHLEKSISLIDPARRRSGRYRMGNYPGVSSYNALSLILWGLGYPERALNHANQAVALAKKLNHPYSLAYALFHAGFLHHWRREVEISLEYAQEVLELAKPHKFQIWHAVGACLHGAGLASLGRVEEGLAEIERGVDTYQEKSPPVFWPLLRSLQAGVYGQAGKTKQGLALINEVLNFPQQGYGKVMLVDLYRLKGALLLALSPEKLPEAEDCFLRAHEISREQGTPMLELPRGDQPGSTLEGYGQSRGGQAIAEPGLYKVYRRFSIPDLVDARQLLDR